MNKNPPTLGRIAAMLLFTLSVFGLLLFLWVSFGGTLPLRPEGYRFKANFPEATLLAKEADVRMAGVNVGKVKATELGPGGRTTEAEMGVPACPCLTLPPCRNWTGSTSGGPRSNSPRTC